MTTRGAGTSPSPHRRPVVTLAAGDEASGLASMVASLVDDNLRDFRSRAVAARLTRGDVVLSANDRDIAVTLSFGPGEVVITEGMRPGAPMLAGDWLALAKLCSGQRSPVLAVTSGDLRVTPGRSMSAIAGAGIVLSVPRSYYGDGTDVSRGARRLAIAALAASAVTGTAYCVSKAAHRPRGHGSSNSSRPA